jgi:hypothetical protein
MRSNVLTQTIRLRISELELRQLREYAAAVDRPISSVVRRALRIAYQAEPAAYPSLDSDGLQT